VDKSILLVPEYGVDLEIAVTKIGHSRGGETLQSARKCLKVGFVGNSGI
jgi:hypothetical protein